jgi:hypothetical protein
MTLEKDDGSKTEERSEFDIQVCVVGDLGVMVA